MVKNKYMVLVDNKCPRPFANPQEQNYWTAIESDTAPEAGDPVSKYSKMCPCRTFLATDICQQYDCGPAVIAKVVRHTPERERELGLSVQGDIEVILPRREYILGTEALKMCALRTHGCTSAEANFLSFQEDLMRGILPCSTYVAYYKGVRCGQYRQGDLLFRMASALYDEDNPHKVKGLTVFKIPKEKPKLGKKWDPSEGGLGVF